MSGKEVFLKKRMKDRRFRKNEDLILEIFVKDCDAGLTVRKIAKKTGLSRSTIYIHHRAVKEIISDYEKYMLTLFSGTIRKKLNKKNTKLMSLYLEMLVFILRNKKIFKMFVKFDDREVIFKMLKKFECKIINFARLPKNSQKILKIYESEVAEIIFEWGQEEFAEDKLEQALADIMYLTETCRSRLMPINQE